MKTRRIGPLEVAEIGLGCMSLSHAYGPPPPPEQGRRVIEAALALGVTLLDTAALYGFGANETLIGETLHGRRDGVVLASKCGMTGVDGRRVIDGRPETLKRTCEESLRRLQTDRIDLYYLHRWDKRAPIEESVGALGDLVRAGKVRAIGLSEVSAATLRRAHAVHPIAAVQNEYSLWTRNPEIALLDACAELGAALVAFGPVGRGFLAGGVRDPTKLAQGDIRRRMPRFAPEAFARNCRLYDAFAAAARGIGCTPGQAALAWLLRKAEHVVPIPGTTSVAHLEENVAAAEIALSPAAFEEVDRLVNDRTVTGARYDEATLGEIDTERFEEAEGAR